MKKGITIFEVIVVTALLSIIALLTFSVLLYVSKSIDTVHNRYETQTDARVVLDSTVSKLQTATSLSIIDPSTALAEIATVTDSSYVYVQDDVMYFYEFNGVDYDIQTMPFFHDNSLSVFEKESDTELTISINTVKGDNIQRNIVTIYLENMRMPAFMNVITGTNGNAVKFNVP